jgi:hypothetical protein
MLPHPSLRRTTHRRAVQATVVGQHQRRGRGLLGDRPSPATPRQRRGARPHPPRLLPTRDPPPTLPHPSLRRTACRRVGSCTDSRLHQCASSSTGERAPPTRRLLHRHTGSSTGEQAPPASGLLHRRVGSTTGSASSWTRRGGSTDSLLRVAI